MKKSNSTTSFSTITNQLLSSRSVPVGLVAFATFIRYCYRLTSISFVSDCYGTCGIRGSCLIDTCYCDAGYEGRFCNQKAPKTNNNKCDHNESCSSADIGRFRVDHDSVQLSHNCDSSDFDFWEPTSIPNPFQDQVLVFKNFWSLPSGNGLGHVMEVGSGPYPTSRLLLETRPSLSMSQLTLVDELEYSTMKYSSNSFTPDERRYLTVKSRIVPTQRIWTTALPHQAARVPRNVDTILFVNSLLNSTNAIHALDNIHRALKPGGILIFGQSFSTHVEIDMAAAAHRSVSSCRRPILQLTKEFLLHYLNKYYDSQHLLSPVVADTIDAVQHEGVKQMVFAIVKKKK